MITVLVPVLDRPGRVAPLMERWNAARRAPGRLIFLVSPHDEQTVKATIWAEAEACVVPFALAGGDYARKINYGVGLTTDPWIFQAGDDISFADGWDDEILTFAEQHEAAQVIGTNDLGNPLVKRGQHSTHSLISRAYIEERGTADEPGKALHEGYWHCWVDNELIETARARRVYFADRRCHVEHLHHIWPDGHGGRKGVNDATYERGQERYREDHRLFMDRRPLWRGARVVP